MAVREQAQVDIQLSNGKKAGETLNELTANSVKLNREIKNLKPGSEEFVKKTADYDKVNKRLKEVKGQVYGVRQANQSLLGSFKQLLPFNAQMSTFGNTIGTVKGGVGGLTKGFGGLRGAIIATGIGAFIVLVTALFGWLKKTQRGMELMNKATAAVGAVFDVFIERGAKLIDTLKLFIDGEYSKGFNSLKETFTGIGEEIRKDVNLAIELSGSFDALTKRENDFILTQAKRKKQIQELIILTRDQKVSYEDRMKALEQANKLELANERDSLELQKEKVRLMQLEYDRGESLETDRQALIQERAKMEDLEAQSLSRQREILNRVNELQNSWNAARAKGLSTAFTESEQQEAFLNRETEILSKRIENQKIETNAKGISMLNALNLQKELNVQAVEDEKQTADLIREINAETAAQKEAALLGGLAVTSSVAGQMASMFEEGSKGYKTFATIQALSDTIAATIAAYKSTAAIPIVGPGLAPFAAATAFAFGMRNVNKIKALGKGTKSVSSESTSSVTTGPRVASNFQSFTPASPVNPLLPGGSNTQSQQAPNVSVNVGIDPVANEIKGLREDLKSGKIAVNQNLQEVNKGLKVLNNLDDERRS